MRRQCLANPKFEDSIPAYVPTPLITRVLLYKKSVDDPPTNDPIPIHVIDKRLCSQLGYEQRELLGRSFVDLIYDLADEKKSISDALMSDTGDRKTTFLVSKDGERKGPYTLEIMSIRSKNSTLDASRRERPCITISVVSCANRAILFKLQDFFVDLENDKVEEEPIPRLRSSIRKPSASKSNMKKDQRPLKASEVAITNPSVNENFDVVGAPLPPAFLPNWNGLMQVPLGLPPPPPRLFTMPQTLPFPPPLGPIPLTGNLPPPPLFPPFGSTFSQHPLSATAPRMMMQLPPRPFILPLPNPSQSISSTIPPPQSGNRQNDDV
uniref:PAS domain-containing protein n=1 Tax=Aureoumbra lagunensis TaxID=44058 RepID=A0A7S3K4V1_9STRA